jgi:hypothetical protein
VRERVDAGGAQLLELAPPVDQDLRGLLATVAHPAAPARGLAAPLRAADRRVGRIAG